MDGARKPSDRDRAVACLVELVAWYGEDDEADYCARLVRATKLLKRIAPETLRAGLEAATRANVRPTGPGGRG